MNLILEGAYLVLMYFVHVLGLLNHMLYVRIGLPPQLLFHMAPAYAQMLP